MLTKIIVMLVLIGFIAGVFYMLEKTDDSQDQVGNKG